jgi:Carboxypeptidase regulatory-like domain
MARGLPYTSSMAVLSLVWFGISLASHAQNATGGVEGAIFDPSQGSVAKAAVTVTLANTGWSVTVLSNELGLYSVRELAPGRYSLRVQAEGFAVTEVSGIHVETGAVASANITLQLAVRKGAVEVTSSPIAVDPVRHTVDTVVNESEIRDLPLTSRNALDLAIIAPGVTVASGAYVDPTKVQGYRAIGISGRLGVGTRVEIDGVEINDYVVGSTVLNLPPDAVHEFQVMRSSNDISAPMTSTGVTSINMKSGTNAVHGRGFADYSNDTLNARPAYLTNVPSYQQARGGVSIGGPFVRNRLFWFGGWEKSALENTWRYTTPLFPQIDATQNVPTSIRYAYGHADWNVRSGVHAFYGLISESNLTTGGSLTEPYSNVNWAAGHTAGLDLTGAVWSHSFRFGFVNYNNRIVNTEFAIPAPRTLQGLPYLLSVGSYVVGPHPYAPQATGESTVQASYDVWRLWGRHVLRWGGHANLVTTGGFIGGAKLTVAGTYSAANTAEVQARGGNPADPLEYPLSSFSIQTGREYYASEGGHGFPYGAVHDHRFSWYAADAIKAGQRLTVNLGVRWEYDTAYFGNSRLARDPVLDTWVPGASAHPRMPRNLLSPSVGFAWDVTGRGQTVVRAGFFRAYEAALQANSDEPAMLPATYGATSFSDALVAFPDGTPINVDGRHQAGNYRDLEGMRIADTMPVLGLIYDTVRMAWGSAKLDPHGVSAFSAAEGLTSAVYPGDQYKLPYSLQFNLGVQREIARGTVIVADYVFNHGVGLPLLRPDLEHRMDAATLDIAAAKSRIAGVLAGRPMDDWIATNTSRSIANFGLMNDTIWPGATSDFLKAPFIEGGFSRYSALQVRLRRQSESLGPLRDAYYEVGYALARTEASDTSTIAEGVSTVLDNHNWNSRDTFGPTALDQTHRLTAITSFRVPGGIRLGSVWSFQTPSPQSIRVPILSSALIGSNNLFGGDLNGDAIIDLMPGLGAGQFGRRVKSLAALNQVIQQFNYTYAGKLGAHAQALTSAGLFTEDQLKRLGAVISPIPLVPLNNPNPWHNVFTTNLMVQRPLVFERFRIGPFLQVFNLFNHAPAGMYSASLSGTFGSLNYDYGNAPPGFRASDLNQSVRGRNAATRNILFGLRIDF